MTGSQDLLKLCSFKKHSHGTDAQADTNFLSSGNGGHKIENYLPSKHYPSWDALSSIGVKAEGFKSIGDFEGRKLNLVETVIGSIVDQSYTIKKALRSQ